MEKKLTILIVDDDFINLKLLEVMLKKIPCVKEVIKAQNGLDALNILDKRDDINTILLDIVMPIMNGLEFLDNLQAKNLSSSIPVIVVTTDETSKNEAFNKGAYDFITKPISDKILSQKLTSIANLL